MSVIIHIIETGIYSKYHNIPDITSIQTGNMIVENDYMCNYLFDCAYFVFYPFDVMCITVIHLKWYFDWLLLLFIACCDKERLTLYIKLWRKVGMELNS